MPFASGVGASIAGQLWQATHDVRYQRELARYLEHDSPTVRTTALGYLEGTPAARSLGGRLVPVIERDDSRTIRSIAASLLLHWTGIVSTPDDAYRLRRPLMERLTSGNARTRRDALRELNTELA